jgi:exonuclease III
MAAVTMTARHVGTTVVKALETVHPNPGPGTRRGRRGGRTEEQKRERNERRREKRRERRREERAEGIREGGDFTVVAWNLQGMSMREQYRRRLREVISCMKKWEWEVLLMSEIRAEQDGVVWLGGDTDLTAVIHGRKTGIILRGRALKRWMEEGQNQWFEERATTVTIGEFRLVAVYQPLWEQADRREEYRHQVENQVNLSGRDEVLVIGGDHNAHVGGDSARPQVAGKWGLRNTRAAGEDLLNWCEEHSLAHVNSFFRHRTRGTWFSNIHRQWYELDGFLVKQQHRHKKVKSMTTINITSLSDHKPVKMVLRRSGKKWRSGEARKRTPQIRWEKLKTDGGRAEFEAETRKRFEEATVEGKVAEEGTNWNTLTDVLVGSAKEVCGVRERKIENPWMVGKDEEVEGMSRAIQEALEEKTELTSRRRTRAVEERLRTAKVRLKEARKVMKRSIRRWEREWWEEKVGECEEAQNNGNLGEMYKILREMGVGTYKKAPATTSTITTEDFRQHFSGVSRERYEVEPAELRAAVERVPDISRTDLAREENDLLNQTPQSREILAEMKKVKDSAPGEDGVRMRYINCAAPEVRDEIVRMVKYICLNIERGRGRSH